ncbi:hypothetical protein MLD38_009348 [Melastoma candidum]|uniref:Uncharacterized protein n=1 Tax=Melastoma candidum TaxID=119954 RepID=A0ACB9RWY3_9MYRT|nr:hypothetical protein MLD38_009348 [Melastoma candidum]
MARDDGRLTAAKRAFRVAREEGNREEEARWANVVGDIHKNRGEYVEALKWLRIDHDVTSKYLPSKQLLPTCQSLGEVYLRLGQYKDALIYQKKHLELAKEGDDLIEQQRASTQLGRTYHELFLKSADDHAAIRNAKKYFKSAMKHAKSLKESPPNSKSTFLKEYIDAHNNIGMLELDLDNLEEAREILQRGLDICDEEEISKHDDGRSRLHHNLGNVFMEMRMWDKARHHIEKDIIICKAIGHCQGEAKGYINLAELHYRVQKYSEAELCYQKALKLAKSMEDEDALVEQIKENIQTVKEAVKVMDDLKNEEQNFKKLARNLQNARGSVSERKCLLELNKSVDIILDKASIVSTWLKHLEFAKRKKSITSELWDKEKLADSYLVIGESYQKLRIFNKALKWFKKSWEIYKSIGNMEGQVLAKINIGNVLDCQGNWTDALEAFEVGYRIAVESNLPSLQLSALENMHYSQMIRFDNIEEGRRLQLLIDELKQSRKQQLEPQNMEADCCSETDTGDDCSSNNSPTRQSSPMKSDSCCSRPFNLAEMDDDAPLISFFHSKNLSPKMKESVLATKCNDFKSYITASPKGSSKASGLTQTVPGRKRVRVILSDEEEEDVGVCSKQANLSFQCGATSKEAGGNTIGAPASSPGRHLDVSVGGSKFNSSCQNPVNLEESICSLRSSPRAAPQTGKDRSLCSDDFVCHVFRKDDIRCDASPLNNQFSVCNSQLQAWENRFEVKFGNDVIQVDAATLTIDNEFCVDSLKAELACLYFLQLPMDKKRKGLLPIIQQIIVDGRPTESSESNLSLGCLPNNSSIEAVIGGWMQKPLIKLYVESCDTMSEPRSMKLLKKLYNLEVSEDEVIVSDCELQDVSVVPLLNSLHAHGTVTMLNLSHNTLGNGAMEKLVQGLSSGKNYGDLTLDLHCNRFGPTALCHICESSVMCSRLVVLNISGNRLTDACGSFISSILKNCKALYNLNIEKCSISSRTVQKISDALDSGSSLQQLYIGYNDLISSIAIIHLLSKLTTLIGFSELSLNGLKLSKAVVDSLCQMCKSLSLSVLMLGGTNIGNEEALQLSESVNHGCQELAKFDLSACALTSEYLLSENALILLRGILELDLGGNNFAQEGSVALALILMHPDCCVRVLNLSSCQLGMSGVLQVIEALSGNDSLKELNVANNVYKDELNAPDIKALVQQANAQDMDTEQPRECATNCECCELEVADSEDGPTMADPNAAVSCTSSYDRTRASESPFTDKLAVAIKMAKHLECLDLSGNSISSTASGSLYAAWLCSRASARRHVKGATVHFCCAGRKLCQMKPCCKRY